jgi:hypothetical protein
MIGGKENIGDAPWKMGILDDEELGSGVPSPKKQRLSMATGDADAFVVPRKRTNANHLITPRKPSRKTPLIDHAQASVIPQIPSETMFTVPLGKLEPTPDASKSHANLSPQKMPPNDWNYNDNRVTASTEKPVRRKSLRQSTRRLTRGTTPEQPPAAPAEEITAGFNNYISESAAPAIERPKKDAESLRAVCDSIEARGLASSADALKNGAIGAFVQEPVALKAVEESSRGSQDEAELSVEGYLAPLNVVEESMNESPRLQQQEVVLAQNSGKANKGLANIEVDPAIAIGEKFTSRANQTPKSQPPVLNSIELGAEISFVSPTKSAGTPRLRRKTPQRRGSRRSTRLTRANSVPPEDISAQKIAAHKPSAAEISNPTSAPIKPGVTSTPTMETSKPADHDAVVAVHTLVENANSQHTEATELASKLSIEIEIQDPEVGSTGVEAIATTHSSDLVNQSEHVKILEPVFNDISSGVEVSGEGSNLAISATFGDIPSLADTGSEDHNGAITATFEDKICFEGGNLNTQEEATMEIGAAITLTQTKDEHISSPPKPSLSEEFAQDNLDPSLDKPRASSVEALEVLEPISIRISTKKLLEDSVEETTDDLPETSTPNPSTTELVDTISENAPANGFDHDDTDMLRNFLTRVKANKAAKASTTVPKRKRSLPHSPIRLPLGSEECGLSPSSPKTKDDFDVSLPAETSTKRKHDGPLGDEDATEPKSIRRSGRTRLPVKATTVAAPSFIDSSQHPQEQRCRSAANASVSEAGRRKRRSSVASACFERDFR